VYNENTMAIILPPAPPNPWKKIGSKKIYKNSWVDISEDAVMQPSGKPGVYGNIYFGSSVGIVVLRDDGSTLLVGQWRYLLDQYTWEIPTGGVDGSEDLMAAAKRELQEETGVTADEWVELGKIELPHAIDTGVLFLARGVTVGEKHQEDDEQIQTHWLPFEDALELVRRNIVTNWLSQAALFRAKDYLEK
jgi:ADP-ribose pyrophosphatase